MPGPTLAEVRAKGQPPEVLARLNDEHWFGRLYMRKLSPYATIVFARLGWSPNAVTVCFMLSGVAAGVLAAVPGLPAAVGVFLLIQLYLLFDCADGELARYTGRALPRRLSSVLKVQRVIQSVELSVLFLAAAIADAVGGDLTATRVLTVAALVVGVVMTAAHLVAIVASSRLR